MIGNTGDTQPVRVPGLPLCIRFGGKPEDLKRIQNYPAQALETKHSDSSFRDSSLAPDPVKADALPLTEAPLAKAPLAGLPSQPAEAAAPAADAAETDMSMGEQPEEDLLVIHPRPAERRAEDFMRDWMRRFTRT